MIHNKASVVIPVKKVSFCILTIISIIMIGFTIIYYADIKSDINDKAVINLIDRQQMDIQTIIRNSQILCNLTLKTVPGQTKDAINRNLENIKINMQTARLDYEALQTEISKKQNGFKLLNIRLFSLSSDNTENHNRMNIIWKGIDKNIQKIVNSKMLSNDLSGSFEYIENNSEELINLTDKYNEQFLYNSIQLDQKFECCEIVMIIVLVIMLAYYLYHLHRYIIIPYNQLYQGINKIGLSSYPAKQNTVTGKKGAPLVDEVNNLFLKINNLISLIENINNNNSFMETLTFINNTFSAFIPYNYIGIALISEDKKIVKASYGVSDGTITGLPEKIMGVSWPLKETSLGLVLESGKARIINDLDEYCKGKPLKPYNKIILEAGVNASIALPLKVSGEHVGMIFFSSKYKNVYNTDHLNILGTLANSLAISFNQNILANDLQYSSVLALAKLSEARDEDTGEHMERMGKYSRTIAQLLYENQLYPEEITIEYIDLIERFSPLHDIGKVGILDEILLKPGKLTPEEFNDMKKHTLFGAKVLKAADMNLLKKGKSVFGLGVEIAEEHHEKWDGSGYPYGRKAQEIPLSARITAIADVLDALTSKRPYKEAFSLDESLRIIMEGRGKHFDPSIIDVIFKNRKRIEDIYYKYKKIR